jgi:hypothetical protein
MVKKVSFDTIDDRILSSWADMMGVIADSKFTDLAKIVPFPPLQLTYPQVCAEVSAKTTCGMILYRMMVIQMKEYYMFEKKKR